MRALRGALVALVLFGIAWAVPSGAVVRPTVQTLELVRTTTGPASFRLTVQGSPDSAHPHGFDGTFSARLDHGRLTRVESLGATTFDYDSAPEIRGAGQRIQVCQPLGGCIINRTLAYGIGVSSSDKGGADLDNRLYIVEEGPAVIAFKGNGWVMRRVAMNYRYITANAADADGAFTGATSAEMFRAAATTGGRSGSIATGTPPCSIAAADAGASPPRGVGTATLTGGISTTSLTCPNNVGQPFLTGLAHRATTWRLNGPVIGDNTGMNVPLFVLDLPRAL